MDKVDELNIIHDKYKDKFKQGIYGLHNLLWQIMVNESMIGRVVTFHVNVTEDGNEIVIASAIGGYHQTGVIFASRDWDKCADIAEEMATLVFGSEFWFDHNHIMCESMELNSNIS